MSAEWWTETGGSLYGGRVSNTQYTLRVPHIQLHVAKSIFSELGGGGGVAQGVWHFLYGVSMGTSLHGLLFPSWVFTIISVLKRTSSFAFCLEKFSEY